MASKRPDALAAIKLAAQSTKRPPAKPARRTKAASQGTLTTAIHIRRDHWELLRRVAFSRAQETGGRASVSAVIGELVESSRAKLERDAG